MLFDSHIHIFPDKLKGKVFNKLAKTANCNYYRDEGIEDAISENSKNYVDYALALHIATNPTQETAVNDFAIICENQHNNIINFGSVHPKSENRISELHRLYQNGIKGIKLHPDYQDFMVDDKNVYDIYYECEKLGLIITFHAGKDPYSPQIVHATPKALKTVANDFKELTIIAAHMGGMGMYEDVKNHLAGTSNVYFDTAIMSNFLNVNQFETLVNLHTADKILFATDSPWSNAKNEKELIEKSSLTVKEKNKIYYENAFNLFKINL